METALHVYNLYVDIFLLLHKHYDAAKVFHLTLIYYDCHKFIISRPMYWKRSRDSLMNSVAENREMSDSNNQL